MTNEDSYSGTYLDYLLTAFFVIVGAAAGIFLIVGLF